MGLYVHYVCFFFRFEVLSHKTAVVVVICCFGTLCISCRTDYYGVFCGVHFRFPFLRHFLSRFETTTTAHPFCGKCEWSRKHDRKTNEKKQQITFVSRHKSIRLLHFFPNAFLENHCGAFQIRFDDVYLWTAFNQLSEWRSKRIICVFWTKLITEKNVYENFFDFWSNWADFFSRQTNS